MILILLLLNVLRKTVSSSMIISAGGLFAMPAISQAPIQSVKYTVDDTLRTGQEMKTVKPRNDVFNFSGFLKYEAFIDTRQTINVREGLVVLYPDKKLMDSNNNDINATQSFNMLSIHSRLRNDITGPMVLQADSKVIIEADFYGNENQFFSDLNGLRLFNAYMLLNWKKTELLAGQYWHPMSIPEYLPSVVSFNAGAPFHPVSRNPQIKVSHTLGAIKLLGFLISQRDFASTGPEGQSSQYLRNSGLPNIHFQLHYNNDSSRILGGIGIDYKKLLPQLSFTNVNGDTFKAQETLNSISYVGFMNFEFNSISLKVHGIYAQNAFDILLLGGYGVKKTVNTQTGEKEFANINTTSLWADFKTNGTIISFGIFCGYTKNLGANEMITGPFYSRGSDIDFVSRVSPRVIYRLGPLDLAIELEYTTAGYGIVNFDGKGGVTSENSASNLRTLLSLKYAFGNLF